MRTILTATVLLALTAPAPAAEWEQVTTDLAKKEKAGFGGLCGVVVNRATKSSLAKGKIIFQSEGAEIYYRNIVLTPLRK